MTRFFVMALCAVIVMGSLSACGRKGDPEFPDGSQYPRDYPNN
ncbi:lipoprotein [Magnetovibrio sp. PR-2]